MPYRHAVRVSPQFSNRMIEAARSVLNRYIPDIYLYSDVYKGEESGKCGRLTPPRMDSKLNTLIDPRDMRSPLLPKPRRPHSIVRKPSRGLAKRQRTLLFKLRDLYLVRLRGADVLINDTKRWFFF